MGLLGGKKNKEIPENERVETNVLSIRGQLASSNRFRGTCLAVGTAINKPADSAHHNSACAHWTRFNRHIKSCAA